MRTSMGTKGSLLKEKKKENIYNGKQNSICHKHHERKSGDKIKYAMFPSSDLYKNCDRITNNIESTYRHWSRHTCNLALLSSLRWARAT